MKVMKRSYAFAGLLATLLLSAGLLAMGFSVHTAQAAEMPLTTGADASLQTQAVTKYPIWIAGKQVTSKNKGNVLGDKRKSVKYTPSNNTLTLKKAKIKGALASRTSGGGTMRMGIFVAQPKGLTIVLKGSSTISVTGTGTACSYGIDVSDGVGGEANLLIKGSGKLKVQAGKAGLFSFGIISQNLNILGSAKVTARGGKKVKTSKKADNSVKAWVGSYGVHTGGFLALGGSAKLTAIGKTKALSKAPTFGESYTPQVKAGASAKKIKVNKKNPASSVYTKYKYVAVSKAKATSSKPAKIAITKLAPLGGGFNVKWSTLSKNCTAYEMQISMTSAFAAASTKAYETPSSDIDGGSVTNLSGGTKYYVRVRGINKVGSKTYYGAWSAAKSVTTKAGQPAG